MQKDNTVSWKDPPKEHNVCLPAISGKNNISPSGTSSWNITLNSKHEILPPGHLALWDFHWITEQDTMTYQLLCDKCILPLCQGDPDERDKRKWEVKLYCQKVQAICPKLPDRMLFSWSPLPHIVYRNSEMTCRVPVSRLRVLTDCAFK